jgi:hypothetical protein
LILSGNHDLDVAGLFSVRHVPLPLALVPSQKSKRLYFVVPIWFVMLPRHAARLRAGRPQGACRNRRGSMAGTFHCD